MPPVGARLDAAVAALRIDDSMLSSLTCARGFEILHPDREEGHDAPILDDRLADGRLDDLHRTGLRQAQVSFDVHGSSPRMTYDLASAITQMRLAPAGP